MIFFFCKEYQKRNSIIVTEAEWQLPAAPHLNLPARLIHMQTEKVLHFPVHI